jgi:hypothetical protein
MKKATTPEWPVAAEITAQVQQEIAALRDFNLAYVAYGSKCEELV